MTTLVGIKANKGRKGIILASDLSGTISQWKPEGDVAYREQTKFESQKLYTDDKREVALGMTGIFDKAYSDFLSKILKGDIDIKKAASDGFFKEFENLNLKRWGGKLPATDEMNSLLVASRFDKQLGMYSCYPLGIIEPRDYISIGSGSKYAFEHIAEQKKLIPEYITLDEAVDLAVEGLEKASKDLYTGGLDLVVMTEEGIKEFGKEIKESMEKAKKDTIEKIKKDISN